MEGMPNYQKDERPWGNFERFTLNEASTVKIITVKAGADPSPEVRAEGNEFWRVLSGSGRITVGLETHDAAPGRDFFIPAGTTYKAEGGPEPLVFLEIMRGK